MEGILPDTATTSADDHLVIGGCDVAALADRYGTPLWIVDRATVESRAKAFAAAVGPESVFFAGKAFLCVAICELIESTGLGLDVCTGGELATALAANFPPERIIFHGNNKSIPELEAARDAGVGRIVVDSFEELERLARVGGEAKVLLRITPGVEAHTHEFVQTGQEDSKFGFTLAEGIALKAARRATELDIGLVGIHAHIGSQIFELAAFDLAVRRLAEFAAQVRSELDLEIQELNVGGGLGIAHTRDELTPDPTESVARIQEAANREFAARGLKHPEVFVEPGRSLVGAAAVTVYRVGTVKNIPGVRTYVAVDGGMSDNIRPALYGARYEAFVPDRMNAEPGPRVTVCGKHCESGDVLIKDVHLPADIGPGDLLCVPATGAYTFAMASNYNRVPRPPVVLVSEGTSTVIVERETSADLLKLDRRIDGSKV